MDLGRQAQDSESLCCVYSPRAAAPGSGMLWKTKITPDHCFSEIAWTKSAWTKNCMDKNNKLQQDNPVF
jgi:hypothetical protein